MTWIEVSNKLPDKEGKYVIKTTTAFNNILKLEAFFNGKSFDVRNQVVTHWLKEDI